MPTGYCQYFVFVGAICQFTADPVCPPRPGIDIVECYWRLCRKLELDEARQRIFKVVAKNSFVQPCGRGKR